MAIVASLSTSPVLQVRSRTAAAMILRRAALSRISARRRAARPLGLRRPARLKTPRTIFALPVTAPVAIAAPSDNSNDRNIRQPMFRNRDRAARQPFDLAKLVPLVSGTERERDAFR